MSDKGDKVCPLCTEEMDLTDQQLKPCKCGYEICVWCWNHIMEMAEKDNTEGRCPACRTAYDKERIVGMAADCEKLVAEINSERKLKSQKAKPNKPSEGRMQLSNVRVIQRNLVYIIGLPLNLADEALLQRREYFGQYGKVLKVSISRTANGIIQHSSNNSCCVYITYSKEEEAVRCIQSVHSFALEGRILRACFGTTKYCHAWLKNMPCSIPDCLYLHEFGAQEDSFTKDDLVSAFTRSRVQQIIGATNNLHRRSGNVLPPPVDEYTDTNLSSPTKLDSKSSLFNVENSDGGSCADGGAERSNTFPGAASWVMRVSSSVPPATCLSISAGTLSHKAETSSGPQVFISEVVSTKRSSDIESTMIPEGGCEVDPLVTCSNISTPPAGTSSLVLAKPSSPGLHENENFLADEDNEGLCSALSSVSIASCLKDENSDPVVPGSLRSNHNLPISGGSQQDVNPHIESSALQALRESSIVEDLLGFDDLQLKASGDDHNLPSLSCQLSSKQNFTQSGYHSWKRGQINNQSTVGGHPSTVPVKCDASAFPQRPDKPVQSNGFFDNQPNSCLNSDVTTNNSNVLSRMGLGKYLEGCDITKASANSNFAVDIGESSIISSILSMDMDVWEDTLTSPQTLVRLLGETDGQHGSLKVPSLRKVQDSNQSRFSFARQDDFYNQESNLGHTHANAINRSPASHYCNENKDLYMDSYRDISSNGSSVESNSFISSHPFSASKFSAIKAPISPPGFSLPSRAVPPGFPTHGAMNYDANHLLQNSAPSSRNVGSSIDVEFVDPAIMEVGSGILAARLSNPSFDMRPALSPRISPFNHDTELQMLMQQSISVKQNPRFPDHFRNRFSPPNDAYSISSMLLGQSPPNNSSPFSQMATQQVRNLNMSHGCWGSWDEIKSVSNLGMSELLMNGKLGFNKIIPSPEDLKYQMSGSSNLYNRGFAL
ncbi:uncharacterized protein LOC105642163 isoform X2 [Jatropha curcas]|uniref:uncharacterized protein LOC105642163 isoform X2 n=1 Tax=Jatropha curcas TaxID=180498 RepID=UPI0005FB5494|nr:uncharacterized protein LOC105642163 isoform X2 [Jatropha curcas]